MVVRQNGDSRPDNSTAIVGEEGIPVRQDDVGIQIQRLGIAGADADWGPEKVDITDTDERIAKPDRVGGTREFSALLRSEQTEPFSVVVVWNTGQVDRESISEAEACDECIVERPDNAQDGTEHLIASIKTKGDYCWIFVEDESQQGVTNEVMYTINFH